MFFAMRPFCSGAMCCCAAIIVALSTPVAATAPTNPPASLAEDAGPVWYTKLTAGDVSAMEVENRDGEPVGTVNRVAIDAASGELFAMLKVAGWAGVGEHSVALPMRYLTLQDSKLIMPTNLTREDLQAAPSVANRHYRNLDAAQLLMPGSLSALRDPQQAAQ